MLANAQALSVLFALLSYKIPAHLFAKPPTEVHNARQCTTLAALFALLGHKITAYPFANHMPSSIRHPTLQHIAPAFSLAEVL
jgi:hypothetical protein